jgi:hydrogenase maturation protease
MTTLADRIEQQRRGRTLAVVGVGHPLRGDDAAGVRVIERLQSARDPRVLEAEVLPENCIGELIERSPGVVLFVDAADMGDPPGTCRLESVASLAPRAESTHAPSLRLTAELLAAHGIDTLLLGIQPLGTRPGQPLSPVVAAAVDEAAEAIACVLGREACHG